MVLAVATYADPATRRMFDHVAARGVEVVLVMPRRIRHPFGPADVPETPWPTPGVLLERLDTWYSHDNGTHVVMRGLPGLIRRHRPDVIHCVLEPWSVTCLQVAALLATMPRGRRPRLGVQAGETKPEQGSRVAAAIRKSLYRAMLRRCDYFMGWSPLVIRAAERMGLNGLPHS
ncbi:MAG TPA: glycosyltransferase, partial [Candidatus Polarisedimenticolia bacterium]|nr:glycosyltransferase [Candidatus Polarisedimenticolia bacterium]